MNQKSLLIGAIILVVVLVGGYFLFNNQGGSQSQVSIGSFSTAIDYAPYLVARNQGWFGEVAAKYGKTVKYTEFQSLAPINESFASGDIDIVFEAEAPAIVGKAANIPLKIVHSGVNLRQEIIVPTNSTISSVSDLKGKKIAVTSGSSAHQGAVKALQESGISLNDVQIIDMIPPDAKAAFETGQVDAWAIWPPFPQQEKLAGKGKTIPGSEIFIQSIVTARAGFMQDSPQLSSELLGVVEKAQKWVKENPAEAQQIVASELDIDLAVVQAAWPVHDFTPTLGAAEIQDMQEKAQFLKDVGLVNRVVNVKAELVDAQ